MAKARRYRLEAWFLHSHVAKTEYLTRGMVDGLLDAIAAGAEFFTWSEPDGSSLTLGLLHLVTLKITVQERDGG